MSVPWGVSTRRIARGVGPAKLEDQVVASGPGEDSLLGVVDDVIGTEAPYHVDVAGAADASDLGAEMLGDLDSEGPDPAGGADDQDVMSCLESPDS